MQFIYKDHDRYRSKGHRIVDSFIAGCWQKDSEKYINLQYSGLKRNKEFNDLLLEEQKGLCCYCMRKIPSGEATLEHVIPHHIKTDLKNQLSHYYCYISPQRVIYQSTIEQDKRLKYPPYPHCIAYENLTASCDGRIYESGEKYILHACCNNKRGNDKIIPLFFLPRIHSILKYEEDGSLLYTDEYETTIKALNINCDSLRLIRKIWARVRKSNIKLTEVEAGEYDMEIRKNILVILDVERQEEKKMQHVLYWKLLIQFDWFYHYFNLKSTYLY
jgi:hypothetical protein